MDIATTTQAMTETAAAVNPWLDFIRNAAWAALPGLLSYVIWQAGVWARNQRKSGDANAALNALAWVIHHGVQAAEHLAQTNQIDRDERLQYVAELVQAVPALRNVPDEVVHSVIEATVRQLPPSGFSGEDKEDEEEDEAVVAMPSSTTENGSLG